jgi:phospholipase/lecithinase/hemolysin
LRGHVNGAAATPHDFMMMPLLIPSAPYAKGGVFWDGIHPTKAAHALLAQLAASVLP